MRRCATPDLEIVIVLDAQDARLEKAVGPAQFDLYCTPAINLFPKRTDRIHLSESEYEYHVVPDRTRPMDYEIFQVTEVLGYGTSGDEKQEFLPFYALHDRIAAEDMSSYYTVHREPRMLSTKQRSQGARSSYVGSEVFLSLVDSTEAPIRPQLKQLAVATAVHQPRPQPAHPGRPAQQRLRAGIRRPHPGGPLRRRAHPAPARPTSHGDPTWRLISHLSLNYLSITDDGQRRRCVGAARAALAVRRRQRAHRAQANRRRAVDVVAIGDPPVARRRTGGLRPRRRGHAYARRDRLRGHGRVSPRLGAGTLLRQVRVHQFVQRNRAQNHSAQGGRAMASEARPATGDCDRPW